MFQRQQRLLEVRIVVTVVFITLLLLPKPFFEKYLQKILIIGMCNAGIGVVVIISIVHDGLQIGVSGVMLALMFNFGFARLLFLPSCVTGVVICFSYNIAGLRAALPIQLIIANDFFLVSGFLSGASITYLLEQLFRANFMRNKELELQKVRTDTLIDNLLPRRIADRLRSGEHIIAESYGEATVFFSDLAGFTSLTKRLSPGHLVEVLTDIFSILDSRCQGTWTGSSLFLNGTKKCKFGNFIGTGGVVAADGCWVCSCSSRLRDRQASRTEGHLAHALPSGGLSHRYARRVLPLKSGFGQQLRRNRRPVDSPKIPRRSPNRYLIKDIWHRTRAVHSKSTPPNCRNRAGRNHSFTRCARLPLRSIWPVRRVVGE